MQFGEGKMALVPMLRQARHRRLGRDRRAVRGTEIAAPKILVARVPWLWAALLFASLLLTYVANGDPLVGNDATANVWLPERVLDHGSLSFTPDDTPFMFLFVFQTPTGSKDVRFRSWDATFDGKTMRDHYREGRLTLGSPLYYLVSTRHPGRYANTFGLGAGLLALPVVAVARPFVGPLAAHSSLLWTVGKVVAAVAVAGSAGFLFFAALAHTRPLTAFVLGLTYGLGTCVWSTSSQSLWQHGPTELFFAMAAFFLVRKKPSDLLCGLACGLAVACRPTSAVLVVAIGLFHLIFDRSRVVRFIVGGVPVAALLALYAWHTFGSPFSVGQLEIAAGIARAKTGNPALWQTPLHVGALGLLVSPARGLLVYSPVVLVALWGFGRVWRDPVWKDWRPIAVAAVALFLLSSKRFDWWGGWCFGYRLLVDAVTLLAFLAIPVAERIRERRVLHLAFVGLFLWSAGVQALGAYAYDVTGWNGRYVYDVVLPGTNNKATYDDSAQAQRRAGEQGGRVEARALNVDVPAYRYRLWSVGDNPILYYLLNFSEARKRRHLTVEKFLGAEG